MSQSSLGAAANATFQQIQKYENGTNRLSVSRLVHFADALQVPLVALLDGLPKVTGRPPVEAPVVERAAGKRVRAA
jgi:transcriptional regulator with XRE-family HTH domain